MRTLGGVVSRHFARRCWWFDESQRRHSHAIRRQHIHGGHDSLCGHHGFNEGLGSLYEQSREKEGHIRGLTNWRLPLLQKGIKAGRLQSFEQLTALNTADFYGEAGGYSSYYGQRATSAITSRKRNCW